MTEPLTALERQARDESLRLRDEAEGQAAKIAYLEAELKAARAEVKETREVLAEIASMTTDAAVGGMVREYLDECARLVD